MDVVVSFVICLVTNVLSQGGGISHPQFIYMHPVPDKDFFPEPIDQLFAKAPKKRTIQGVTDDEAAIFSMLFLYSLA